MELRVLQYFLAVAREQSISGAAQSLHLSQPTLSTQLKALEEELGKKLMIRGNRKITLTEEGMILRKSAEEILSLVQKTEHDISSSDENISGDIHIGAGETDIIRVFAQVAQELNTQYPDIHYHISSGNSVFVLEQLDKGLIDFGLIYGDVDRTKYDSLKMPFKDVWGVLMRKDSPLAQKSAITSEDLLNKPLILSHQKNDSWAIAEWLGCNISRVNVVATYNLVFNASLLVEEGLGYAVCFDKLINTSGDSRLCFRPLSPKLESNASIIWKKYQIFPKAAAKFLERLQDNL